MKKTTLIPIFLTAILTFFFTRQYFMQGEEMHAEKHEEGEHESIMIFSQELLNEFGVNSIKRWLRPVSFQDFPQNLLPNELKNDNPLMINRKINGVASKNEI